MMNNAFLSVIPSARPSTQTIHSSFGLNRLFLGLLAGFRDPLRNYLISQRSQRAFFFLQKLKGKDPPWVLRGWWKRLAKEQLEHHFVVQMTASFHLFGDADRPHATYLLSSFGHCWYSDMRRHWYKIASAPAGSAGAVCKAPGSTSWAIRSSSCLPARESEQGLSLHETCSPLCAWEICKLCSCPHWASLSSCNTCPSRELAAYFPLWNTVPPKPPSLSCTWQHTVSPLTLPNQAHTDCSHLWMQAQLPLLTAHDSPSWSHTVANYRYALHLKICPQFQSKPLTCPSGPAWE